MIKWSRRLADKTGRKRNQNSSPNENTRVGIVLSMNKMVIQWRVDVCDSAGCSFKAACAPFVRWIWLLSGLIPGTLRRGWEHTMWACNSCRQVAEVHFSLDHVKLHLLTIYIPHPAERCNCLGCLTSIPRGMKAFPKMHWLAFITAIDLLSFCYALQYSIHTGNSYSSQDFRTSSWLKTRRVDMEHWFSDQRLLCALWNGHLSIWIFLVFQGLYACCCNGCEIYQQSN